MSHDPRCFCGHLKSEHGPAHNPWCGKCNACGDNPIYENTVCDVRADTGSCSCAQGCAAKQLDEMRIARDQAAVLKFSDLQRLQRGVHLMSVDDFSEALYRSIGASRDYARDCWSRFQDDPLGYMISRRPEIQGEALMRVAWEKGGQP